MGNVKKKDARALMKGKCTTRVLRTIVPHESEVSEPSAPVLDVVEMGAALTEQEDSPVVLEESSDGDLERSDDIWLTDLEEDAVMSGPLEEPAFGSCEDDAWEQSVRETEPDVDGLFDDAPCVGAAEQVVDDVASAYGTSKPSVGSSRVSVRELMRERAEEQAVSGVVAGDNVSVKDVLASRGVNGSRRSVLRTIRDRMHGGDALRGQTKCATKVIG